MKNAIGRYAPICLGALFIYSGGYKILHPGEATYALMSLDWRRWLANDTIIVLIALELYLGLILLLKVNLKYSLTAAMILLLGLTGFLWYLSTMSHPLACGCMGLMGMFSSTKKAAIFGLLRNCILLWCIKLSYDYYFGPPSGEQL